MTSADIALTRLCNQQMATTAFLSPEKLVSWLVAIQAQEYAYAKWAIGLRLPGSTDAMIEDAFNKGHILRTHVLRPTWHFVTGADIRWMLQLTAPLIQARSAYMYRQVELDGKIFKKAQEVIIKSLRDKKQLTRTELQLQLERKKIVASGFRLGYIMMQAELDGLICSGPREGNQFTYALLDERVGPTRKLNDEEALAALAERYFYSRGPATANDFATWSGLPVTRAKSGIAMAKNLETITKDNQVYYHRPIEPPATKLFQKALLLPPYDEYLMGYKYRHDIFVQRDKIKPSPKPAFENMILVNGQVAGTWKRQVQKNSLDISCQLFQPSAQREKLCRQAIKRFSVFLQTPASVTIH